MRDMAARAHVAISTAHAVESGRAMSIDTYARVAVALGLRASLALESGRPRASKGSTSDIVHAAMGELEARRLAAFGYTVAIDEPYQHFQFAGRADVLAWSLSERRLLHMENKTRIVDIQDLAGSFNAKRAYLAESVAQRLGVRGGWQAVCHVVAVLWSAENLHVVRLREGTFRALCPSPLDDFGRWWAGVPTGTATTSALILFDPNPGLPARRARFAGTDRLRAVDPRYRGYADAAAVVSRRSP